MAESEFRSEHATPLRFRPSDAPYFCAGDRLICDVGAVVFDFGVALTLANSSGTMLLALSKAR
jgi:hypothetical protein